MLIRFISHPGTNALSGIAALGVAVAVAGTVAWGHHRPLAWGLFVVGGCLIAFSVVSAGLILLARGSASETANANHRRDLMEYADTLGSGELREIFRRQGNPKYDLLYEGLQAHFPALAVVDKAIEQAVSDSNETAGKARECVAQEAAAAGFGPSTGGLQLLNFEATHFAQTGNPHFDEKWQLEIRDGTVHFGAYSLGKWRMGESAGDADAIKRELLAVLQRVRGLPEVVSAREAMRRYRRLEAERHRILTEISVTHNLPGRCKLCP